MFSFEYRGDEELFSSLSEGLPQVPEDISAEMGSPITPEELFTALQSMKEKPRHQRGTCGDLLERDGEDLMTDFNDMLLALSCRRAVITLLPRKETFKILKTGDPSLSSA